MLTNLLGTPLSKLQTLIAASTAFQAFSGSAEAEDPAAAAASKIYILYQDASGAAPARAILTYDSGDWNAQRDAFGSGLENYRRNSIITLIFEQEVAEVAQTDINSFISAVGAILNDILSLSASEDFMIISSINMTALAADTTSAPNVISATFKLTWDI